MNVLRKYNALPMSHYRILRPFSGSSFEIMIQKIIEQWLNSTPLFNCITPAAQYGMDYLLVRDTDYTALAVIRFEDDHLLINLPARDRVEGGRILLMEVPAIAWQIHSHKVFYSDPELRRKVQFFVNEAYEQQQNR